MRSAPQRGISMAYMPMPTRAHGAACVEGVVSASTGAACGQCPFLRAWRRGDDRMASLGVERSLKWSSKTRTASRRLRCWFVGTGIDDRSLYPRIADAKARQIMLDAGITSDTNCRSPASANLAIVVPHM